MAKTSLFALVGLLAIGCTEDEPTPLPEVESSVQYLTPEEHLVRASMALRGIRPSIEELQAVHEDPEWLPAIVDFYLTTPEFGRTIREIHAEALLIGVDPAFFPAGFPTVASLRQNWGVDANNDGIYEVDPVANVPADVLAAIEDHDMMALNRSVVDAPLRLVEHVIMNDEPYPNIVLADYTIADPAVAAIFGVPYDMAGEEWQVTRYEDGRFHAGILSDPFIFTRHSSTVSNKNRGRANAVARGLLCYDFLDRSVEIDTNIDLGDEAAVQNAISENAACVNCHQTLDPLAEYFTSHFPIYVPGMLEAYPFAQWNPAFAFTTSSVDQPGYYGTPGRDLRDLGAFVSADPRFSLCAARRFYSYLAQVEMDDIPIALANRFEDALVYNYMSVKEMVRAIVLSDEFRSAASTDEAEAEGLVGFKKVRPEALARTVFDLTGYEWGTRFSQDFGTGEIGEFGLLEESFFGFRVMAGGTDSTSVTRPTHTVNPTSALVVQGLAARAAPWVVDYDFGSDDLTDRRLLTLVRESDTEETVIRPQLQQLMLRLYGEFVETDSVEVDDAWTLFSSALAASEGDVSRTWKVTLYAMLQDVRMVYY
ncbi:MAG: hypothetical protein AAGF12_15805 [Myxococcota bacterium]